MKDNSITQNFSALKDRPEVSKHSNINNRSELKDKPDLEPFVISVGNIAMGGTGKTPHTLHIAKYFQSKGERVSILSLGYKGKVGYGTNVISDGNSLLLCPPLAADEPYMIAKELLSSNSSGHGGVVITGKQRSTSYDVARQRYGTTVVILDDGFQHRQMHRELDIVLLDYKNPISTGFPVPFGYLRQFPSALKGADIIIFTRADSTVVPPRAKKYCEGKGIYFSKNRYSSFIGSGARKGLSDMKNLKVWLMSGIASATQFEAQVADIVDVVLGRSRFKDHHQYTDTEIQNIINKSVDANADIIVTTQKDYVKIPEQYVDKFVYPEISLDITSEGGRWLSCIPDIADTIDPLLKELDARVQAFRKDA